MPAAAVFLLTLPFMRKPMVGTFAVRTFLMICFVRRLSGMVTSSDPKSQEQQSADGPTHCPVPCSLAAALAVRSGHIQAARK